jgi:hypothetical protein
MTVAVCIRCGRMKVGAFTPCLGCRFTPERPDDLAKSVLLSDQVSDRAALETASERLKAGGAVEFDPRAVAEWTAAIQANPQDLRLPTGCVIIWYAPLVIMVVLTLVVVALFAYLKWWAA